MKRINVLPDEFVGSFWICPSSFERDSKWDAAQTFDSPEERKKKLF